MPWVFISNHRLRRDDLEEYLRIQFNDATIEFSEDFADFHDSWRVWLPRDLSEWQRGEIGDLRIAHLDSDEDEDNLSVAEAASLIPRGYESEISSHDTAPVSPRDSREPFTLAERAASPSQDSITSSTGVDKETRIDATEAPMLVPTPLPPVSPPTPAATTTEVQTPPPSSPYPFINIERLRNWKETPWAKLPGWKQAQAELKDRDFIFVVDNSQSMQPYEDDILLFVHQLGYLVKKLDSNDLQVLMTSDPLHQETCKTSTHIKKFVKSKFRSGLMRCNMENTLNQAFQGVYNAIPRLVQVGNKEAIVNRVLHGKAKPFTVLVFTDGVWDGREHGISGTDRPIEKCIGMMKKHGVDKTVVAIQFVRFGHSEMGIRRLKILDDELKKWDQNKGYDIVDHKDRDASIWEILIGPISPLVGEMDEDQSETSEVSLDAHILEASGREMEAGEPPKSSDSLTIGPDRSLPGPLVNSSTNLSASHNQWLEAAFQPQETEALSMETGLLPEMMGVEELSQISHDQPLDWDDINDYLAAPQGTQLSVSAESISESFIYKSPLSQQLQAEGSQAESLQRSKLLDPDHDSAYVSASRTATLPDPSEPAHEGGGKSSRESQHPQVYPGSDEIQSLASDDEDIGSNTSHETTKEERVGQTLMRTFLAEEIGFRVLSEAALAELGRQRFAENMRRLLKHLHKGLKGEAQNEAEKAVAKLLRSRRGRWRISDQLAAHMQPDEENLLSDRADFEAQPKDRNQVETWLASVGRESELDEGIECQDTYDDNSSSGSDEEFHENLHQDEFPFTQRMKVFVRQSRAFRKLQRDLTLIFLPLEIRQVLQSTPRKGIWISQEQDISLLNRLKGWAEDRTLVRWNWWPLQPRKRLLKHGEARLFWQCTCGAEQWKEISPEQTELIKKAFIYGDDHQPDLMLCRRRRASILLLTWFTTIVRQKSPASGPSTSRAAQVYTPAGNLASRSSPGQQPNRGGATSTKSQISNQTGHHRRPPTTQQNQVLAPNTPIRFILFGVKGPPPFLVPAQISVEENSTDHSVFQELRALYKLNRGWLRLWFSVWDLETCQGTRFYKWDRKCMARERRELPTDGDYEYQPRAPYAENPPISPHLFQSLFYFCPFNCKWSMFHYCTVPSTGRNHVERIPQRGQSFESDMEERTWGLEAIFIPSFVRVTIYMTLIMVAPFGFWGWWMGQHPGDLQNASVPAMAAMNFLALFLVGSGILPVSRGTE